MTETVSATLIAPRANGRLSGGFLVNEAWLENAFLRAEEANTAAELERRLFASGERLTLVDSLYLYDPETASTLTRATRKRRVALLAHSLPSLIPGPSIDRRLAMLECERSFLSAASGAIAPSRFMAAALARRGLRRESVQIARPAPVVDGRAGTAHPASVPARSGPPRILTVANWTPAKGIDHAVRALALTATDWRWTLVGDTLSHPTYSQRVRDLIHAEGLADRVEIVSPQSPEKLRAYFAAADVFLLPSLMESYGLVFSEALTFGLPVIGYRCAAVPEVLGAAGAHRPASGATRPAAGRLVDAGDVAALATALCAALDHAFCVDRDDDGNGAERGTATLPSTETSRSELVAALHALDHGAAVSRGRR